MADKQFLEFCLGDCEEDYFSICSSDDEFQDVAESYAIDSGSDDEWLEDSGDGDDMLWFAPDAVSNLLRDQADVSVESLSEVIQTSLAARFEQRLASQCTKCQYFDYGSEHSFDIDNMMTPRGSEADFSPRNIEDQNTPMPDTASPKREPGRMTEPAGASRRCTTGGLRSEAIQVAMARAKQRSRKSLVARMSLIGTKDINQHMLSAANRRATMSIEKAADILEEAGLGQNAVDKMKLVQKAMNHARAEHRKTITFAVKKCEQPDFGAQSGDFWANETQRQVGIAVAQAYEYFHASGAASSHHPSE